jgi:hypothetical protein
MVPLVELEALADRYRRAVAGRLAAPKASEVRGTLHRAGRSLAQATDTVAELGRHELAQ